MKMDIIAGSGNDEFYTPEYAIFPILKYLKNNSTILCPFDTEESNFVKILRREGHFVINRHINYGQDFFSQETINVINEENIDYIISNPPYSCKGEVFEKLFEIGKPFAMLVGVVGLFESQKRFQIFKQNSFEIMFFNRRISYFKDFFEKKPSMNPPFSSVYLCCGILPQKIIFKELNKKLGTA